MQFKNSYDCNQTFKNELKLALGVDMLLNKPTHYW